jgi:hypothetical protein
VCPDQEREEVYEIVIDTYQGNKVPGHGSITDLDKSRRKYKGKGAGHVVRFEIRTEGDQ